MTPSTSPLTETFIANGGRLWTRVGVGVKVVALASVSVYIALFMPTYAIANLGMPTAAAFVSTLVFGVIMSAGSPFIGKLADRVCPARVMNWVAAGTLVLGVPLFILLNQSPNLVTMIGIELVLGVLGAAYFAPLPAIMSAMFPVQIRTTGLSLGYNIGVTVFGGFAPFILTFLISTTGSLLVPGYYVVAIAALSLASIVVSRRVFQQR